MLPVNRRRRLQAAAILGAWTVIALLFAPQNYFANRFSPTPLPGWVVVVASAAIFYIWAAATPLVIWLARRFPFQRGRLARAVVIHIVAAFLVALLVIVAVGAVQSLLPRPANFKPPMPPELLLVSLVATNVLLYWTIVAVTTAITYFQRDQQRELTLVQAQLQSLRNRLQPHFLFNTLNAIAELVYEDTRRAEETITQLSDVLRLTLQHDQEAEITLAQELDLLRKHVAIYQTLLPDRLRVRWAVENDALSARVPTMILQPLVENAIRHGIAPRESGGTVEVRARREGSSLSLAVEDDGVGMPAAPRSGIGLTNTRARLRHLYGDAFTFDLLAPAGGGVTAVMTVPLR
ncbi:MAG TPA: histidine kinase [Thermoanaerobaculia bacterium]|nr:histidine kinase [Thermoanaerobaculia bacterium]